MTDEYELLPEEIIREIASFYTKPQPRISRTFKKVEESLLEDMISYLNRTYSGWNQKIDAFTAIRKGSPILKMVSNHDLDSIALVITLHPNRTSVINNIIYWAVELEAVDVLQFLTRKLNVRRQIIKEAMELKKYAIVILFANDDYPLEQIIYNNISSGGLPAALFAYLDGDSSLRLLDLISNTRDYDTFKRQMKYISKYGNYSLNELEDVSLKFMRNIKSF